MSPHDPDAPPDLPRDPAEYRARPLLGATFWALIAFGVICVLAGAGIAVLAPRFLAAQPPPAAASPAPTPVAPRAPIAALAPIAPPAAAPASPDEVARLNARIKILEHAGARSGEAAAAALAAAALAEASQGSRPFAQDLEALRAAAPGLPELAALARLSETGAPSRVSLAASFPDYAARAARKARKPADGAGLGARMVYVASKVVTLRRVDDVTGRGPDAILARAELELDGGDVARALATLDGLPATARAELAEWRAQAERRAEIDREVAALRARALRDLVAEEPVA